MHWQLNLFVNAFIEHDPPCWHGLIVHGVEAQVDPIKPSAHLHINEPPLPSTEQLPLFWHGFDEHGVVALHWFPV